MVEKKLTTVGGKDVDVELGIIEDDIKEDRLEGDVGDIEMLAVSQQQPRSAFSDSFEG